MLACHVVTMVTHVYMVEHANTLLQQTTLNDFGASAFLVTQETVANIHPSRVEDTSMEALFLESIKCLMPTTNCLEFFVILIPSRQWHGP